MNYCSIKLFDWKMFRIIYSNKLNVFKKLKNTKHVQIKLLSFCFTPKKVKHTFSKFLPMYLVSSFHTVTHIYVNFVHSLKSTLAILSCMMEKPNQFDKKHRTLCIMSVTTA
jgi:hypothetical protein